MGTEDTHQGATAQGCGDCQALFQALIDHAADGFFLITADDGRIVDVNRCAAQSLGYTREELLQLHVSDLDPRFPKNRPASEVFARLAPGTTTTLPGVQIRKDGSILPVEVRMGLCTINGRLHVLALARDITERKKAEQDVRDAHRLEAVGTLASGVAHDFNNLLVPILGYSELLASRLNSEDPSFEGLQAIRTAAVRARELTQQLLAFSRKQVVSTHPIGLGYVVRAFEPLIRRLLREDVDLEICVSPDAGTIQGDATQVERVMMNLITNAQDAMPEGGKVRVLVCNCDVGFDHPTAPAVLHGGRYVCLSVADTGAGMTEEVKARVFEPFFTTKPKNKGTGLGLATVHWIAHQHDGAVWVESEPGKGATFHVCFPRIDRIALPFAAREERVGQRGAETIAVAEDDDLVLGLVCEALRENGYTVLRAHSGEACAAALRAHDGPVHLLLADVVMPDMGASELYRLVLVERPDLKLLCMTGHPSDVLEGRGLAGAAVLHKPFTIDMLLSMVREQLAGLRIGD
jgi:two-component system, cell cycle sensor histidine kinase and response regulator CckA